MKKDRNTFFAESSYMNQSTFPNMPVANQPFGMQAYANQGFYAGPQGIPNNYNIDSSGNTNNMNMNDYESRLSKIERQLNRIDARLSKLENNNYYTTEDVDTTNNIYMV